MTILTPVSQLMREYLRDILGDIFKDNYYVGSDILFIPEENLPCVIIEEEAEIPRRGPLGFDVLRTEVLIKLVVNKKDDFGKKFGETLWRQRLQQLCSARDAETKEYLEQSVQGVLRKNFTMGGRFNNHEVEVRYGIVPRGTDYRTEEAHISVAVEEHVPVSNRI